MSNNNNNSTNNKNQYNHYFSVKRLLETTNNDVDWLINGLIPRSSLCLLSSRPKAGKTNLALQLAIASASANAFLSFVVKRKLKVLFLSLEMNEIQIKKRLINILNYYQIKDVNFNNLPLVFRFRNGNEGIETLKEEVKSIKERHKISFDLIIVDTYVLFKDLSNEAVRKHISAYELESRYLAELRDFCSKENLSILLIYHNRKSQLIGGDITESIMGSTGIAGAVNEIFLLDRKTSEKQAKLTITGHNVEEKTIDLVLEKGIFKFVSGTEKEMMIANEIIKYLLEVKKAGVREILDYLKAKGFKSSGEINNVLKKYDVANNEYGFWKYETEKKKGRGKHLYMLVDEDIEDFESKQTSFEDIEDFEDEDLEGKLSWLDEG